MTEIVNFPDEKAKIIKEACEWLARMDGHELSEEEKAELNNWFKKSDKHRRELERLAKIWDNIEDADINDALLVKEEKVQENYPFHHKRSRFPILKTIAASIFILISAGFLLHLNNLSQFKSTNGKYVTNVGELQTVMLSDGSEIKLNTDTLIEVNYSDGNRNIHLYRGEAHFKVAHDPDKPFTVKARKGDVRALGTVFSVRLRNDHVNVIVEEGKVRIRANETFNQNNNELLTIPEDTLKSEQKNIVVVANAGRNVVFGEQEIESIVQEEKEEIERKFSWRNGMLAFDDEPLSDVINEVSRYTSNQIIIADPEIRSLRVGGYYPISKIQTVLDALELNLGLKIKQVDDRTFYITNDGT